MVRVSIGIGVKVSINIGMGIAVRGSGFPIYRLYRWTALSYFGVDTSLTLPLSEPKAEWTLEFLQSLYNTTDPIYGPWTLDSEAGSK